MYVTSVCKKQKFLYLSNKLKCDRCRGGYVESVSDDGRPKFTCSKCGNTWTAGKSGGKWKK